jgi:hypothetical protein
MGKKTNEIQKEKLMRAPSGVTAFSHGVDHGEKLKKIKVHEIISRNLSEYLVGLTIGMGSDPQNVTGKEQGTEQKMFATGPFKSTIAEEERVTISITIKQAATFISVAAMLEDSLRPRLKEEIERRIQKGGTWSA